MRNLCAFIEYDGANYHGWQRQKNSITIQEIIETSLEKILSHKVTLYGSGRTDTGVHAKEQTANFRTTSNIPIYSLIKAINTELPRDIAIYDIKEVPGNFNARKSAKSRWYRYTVLNRPNRSPMLSRFSYHIYGYIDIERMAKSIVFILGEHDFAAFCKDSSKIENTKRTIYKIDIFKKDDLIIFDIIGDSFLHGMVRTIVGTLLWISRKKLSPQIMRDIISSKNNKYAGPCAPPNGLCLYHVEYDNEIFNS